MDGQERKHRILARIPAPIRWMISLVLIVMVAVGPAQAGHLTVKATDIVDDAIRPRHIKANSVRRPAIRNNTINNAKLHTHFKSRWAVVQAGGDLDRGRGVVSSERTATGVYEIVFNRDVTNCAYIATRGSHTSLGDPQAAVPGHITVGGLSGEPNGVVVATKSAFTDLPDDLAFHLRVAC